MRLLIYIHYIYISIYITNVYLYISDPLLRQWVTSLGCVQDFREIPGISMPYPRRNILSVRKVNVSATLEILDIRLRILSINRDYGVLEIQAHINTK